MIRHAFSPFSHDDAFLCFRYCFFAAATLRQLLPADTLLCYCHTIAYAFAADAFAIIFFQHYCCFCRFRAAIADFRFIAAIDYCFADFRYAA